MTFLAVKVFLKKSWVWLKVHWQVPFLIVWTFVVWVLTRRNSQALVDVLEAKRESYKKQIDVLRSSHNDEILKRENLIKEYEAVLSEVEKEFSDKERNLTEEHKREIKDVVIKSRGNPDEIRKKIEEEFGFKFVE